ncbi:hypothetical protein Tco_0472265 [Tanacetum coccineum]
MPSSTSIIQPEWQRSTKLTNKQTLNSSNTSRANKDNSPESTEHGYDNQRAVNVVGLGTCREAGASVNADQADWKDDIDDESDDQELEAQYMYMAQIQEVTPDPVDNLDNL